VLQLPKNNGSSLFLNCLFIVLISILSACSDEGASSTSPMEFPVVDVIQRDQPVQIEMVGETRGSSDIPIRARVDGFLESMAFVEGSNVKKGDLLYTIDEVPYQTELVKTQGFLAEAKTTLAKAKSDLQRIRPLAEMNAISQMDLDAAVAQYEASLGALQSANAQVKQAKIELSYCRIHSPINGRIGISKVEVGEYVGSGVRSLLNLVSQVDPILVRFSIDEKVYLGFTRKLIALSKERGEKAGERTKTTSSVDLELILADGVTHKYIGHVVTSDATIDSSTGTMTLEASFPNPNRLVLAGQFARIRADIEVYKNALLVPQRSIIERQGEFSVLVVNSQGKVELRKVMVGPKVNKLQIISSGLKEGEKVVLEGIQKLRNGMTIKPKVVSFDESSAVPTSSELAN